MLAVSFHQLLRIVKEREVAKLSPSSSDAEVKVIQAPTVTVSSNFEVQSRRPRSLSTNLQPTLCSIVFRPDVVFMLLRKACKDRHLGLLCRLASLSLQKLVLPTSSEEIATRADDSTTVQLNNKTKSEASDPCLSDYSKVIGDESLVPDVHWDTSFISLVDISSVEEGIFHMLYACAAQPNLCGKLAESGMDFLSMLPLVQALLPALRPPLRALQDTINDNFSQWGHPLVLRALSQIVALSSSTYCPLLRASAGYLSSFSTSQAKAACVMIDLCCGALAPWLPMVSAKVDLVIELVEDLLGVIQGIPLSAVHPRVALKFITLALSGHVDDILVKYKEVKHRVLFLIEMLEHFLEPVTSIMLDMVALSEKREKSCEMALDIIRIAVQKPAILPYLEREWRRGSVAPSVILSILGPNMPLPPDIDTCKSPGSFDHIHGISSTSMDDHAESDAKISSLEVMLDDTNLLFAPAELKDTVLLKSHSDAVHSEQGDKHQSDQIPYERLGDEFISPHHLDLRVNHLQLVHYNDCESRALEYRQLALDLQLEPDITLEGHVAAVDSLLLAAECYLNPFSVSSVSKHLHSLYDIIGKDLKKNKDTEPKNICKRIGLDVETIASLERKRDKTVLEILLQAAELDFNYETKIAQDVEPWYNTGIQECITISPADLHYVDSITIVRQNQALLCQFVMRYLKKGMLNMHEILLQSLLFVLRSATELYCQPEDVIDVVLQSAEHLNGILASHHHHDHTHHHLKFHAIQRHYDLLQKLVTVSLGVDDEVTVNTTTSGFQWSLVPPKCWIHKIPTFSKSPSPLARFLGWMAVSLSAKMFLNDRLFLTSDLSQLTSLLSIFEDDLAIREQIRVNEPSVSQLDHSFQIIFPQLHRFFPKMKEQFMNFGENILRAVCMRLSSLPSAAVSEMLCWFSDLCAVPPYRSSRLAASNAKAIILFVLETVIKEHMEAMVPEMPRVAKILISLCRSSYCDVNFLDAILALLNPIISYSLRKIAQDEPVQADDLESLCFGELFGLIRNKSETEKDFGSRVIFTLGSLYPEFSFMRKNEILLSLFEWVDFTSVEPTTSFLDYLLAFQRVMDSCAVSLAQALDNAGMLIPIREGKEERETGEGLPLSRDEVEEMSKTIEGLIKKLWAATEICFGLHSKLARKLTTATAKCLLFLRGLLSNDWVISLEGLAEDIMNTQQNHCWQVASCILDYILHSAVNFSDVCMSHVCSVMKSFISLAPRISWRMQADKWLTSLFSRDMSSLSSCDHLVDLFCSMLSHWEPEQRHAALKHLGRVVGLNHGQPSAFTSDSINLKVVSGMWDRVASVASSDPSMQMRLHAMELLCGFVPFTEERRLQSFIVGAHNLPGLGKHAYVDHGEPFTRLSIALLANACLYSSFEHVSFISDDVWQRLENIITSKTGFDDKEKNICRALCKLRTDFDDAKEVLKGVLSSKSNSKQSDPAFRSVQESILQVISSLASVQADFDFFSEKAEKEAQELEDAEIELELLQKEKALEKVPGGADRERQDSQDDRVQQIKEEIRSIEKSKLKEEIMARRQRKLLLRQERQRHLDEASLREMELLQELDRERTSEAEREIERQRLLEAERARTRELRYNLELERERQAQRDLQKELELAESGVPSSRRDFSSNPSGRPRERYRERDNGRIIAPEGGRSRDGGTSIKGGTATLAGSRSPSFMAQPPTILQADRAEDRGLPYEDNYEGGRDSGDASSIGDPETASSLDAGGFAGAPRQGRGGKSRQIVERREREGRREGKWERKNS